MSSHVTSLSLFVWQIVGGAVPAAVSESASSKIKSFFTHILPFATCVLSEGSLSLFTFQIRAIRVRDRLRSTIFSFSALR